MLRHEVKRQHFVCQAVDLQHRATAAETECTHLQDIIDELHHELEVPPGETFWRGACCHGMHVCVYCSQRCNWGHKRGLSRAGVSEAPACYACVLSTRRGSTGSQKGHGF